MFKFLKWKPNGRYEMDLRLQKCQKFAKNKYTWTTSSLELKLDISVFLPSDTLVSEIHSLPEDNW